MVAYLTEMLAKTRQESMSRFQPLRKYLQMLKFLKSIVPYGSLASNQGYSRFGSLEWAPVRGPHPLQGNFGYLILPLFLLLKSDFLGRKEWQTKSSGGQRILLSLMTTSRSLGWYGVGSGRSRKNYRNIKITIHYQIHSTIHRTLTPTLITSRNGTHESAHDVCQCTEISGKGHPLRAGHGGQCA